MKNTSILFLLMGLFMSNHAAAEIENYFLEIKKKTIVIGKYEGRFFRKKVIQKFKKEEDNKEEIKQLLLGEGEEKVLYYFHSLFGGVEPYHKHSLKELNELENVDRIISIVWHTKELTYKRMWNQSIEQGLEISEIMESLFVEEEKENFVLCHSMGHRIFEGVQERMVSERELFKLVIFAAADLNGRVFFENMKKLPSKCEKIVIYTHRKDRLLKVSKLIHGKSRMGLSDDRNYDELQSIPNIEQIDVSHSSKRRLIRLSNHIYFKMDKGVQMDIAKLLANDNEARDQWLVNKGGNFYELK